METGQDVLVSDGMIGPKQLINRVTVREHLNNLINRNSRARYTRLSVTHCGVDRDTVDHRPILPFQIFSQLMPQLCAGAE
jgi:hypothetical protein